MRGQRLAVVVAFTIWFAERSTGESPPEAATAHTNNVSEIIPIKYALAADVAAVLSAEKRGQARDWVNRSLVTTSDITNFYAQVHALGPRRITLDERSNSLLVTASESDLPNIKQIISKVDVVLTQVLVEGVVLQFPLEESKATAKKPRLPLSFNVLTNAAVPSNAQFASKDAASKTNPPEPQLSYEATLAGDLDAVVTTLVTNTPGARIIQRPRIQTSVGVPATMFAGMFAGATPPSYYSGAAYSCGCPLRQLNSGVTIEVTCMLTPDGFLLTDIQLKIDRAASKVVIQNVGEVPVTESYNVPAHVAVRDRQIIILGGIIQAAKAPIFSEVAALENVPVAGPFLNRIIRSPTHTKKYELVVLIRPTILPVPEVKALTAQRDQAAEPE